MVIPVEEKGESNRTLEDRLADKFDTLQLAREQRNHQVFDEIVRSIEILFKAIPDLYEQYRTEKDEMDVDKEALVMEIEEKASNAPDRISAQYIRNVEGFQVEWDYREALEEYLMELMSNWKLVVTKQEDYAYIEPVKKEIKKPEPIDIAPPTPIEPELQPQPQQTPPVRKPKLSIDK